MGDKLLVENKVIFDLIKPYLSEGYNVILPVKGNSMRPFLNSERDKVLVQEAYNLKKRDLVLSKIGNDNYVLHRIIKIKGQQIVLRGDGNIKQQEICKKDDVIAQIIGFFRENSMRYESIKNYKWRCYSLVWPNNPLLRRIFLYIDKLIRRHK